MIPRYAPTFTYADLFRSLSGDIVQDLGERLAALYQVKHVFLFDSARVALYALLKAHNKPGDVLMPAYNCIVVPEAVCYAGYEPVFADIDYPSLSLTPENLKQVISTRIKVVLVTHLLGVPADLDEILSLLRQYEVLVVEDAAPAVGAEYRGQLVGRFGDAAILSFQSTKVISAETGGALLTNNTELASKVEDLLQSASTSFDGQGSFIKACARKFAMSPGAYPFVQAGYRLLRHEDMYEIVAPHNEIPAGFLKPCSRFSGSLFALQLDRLDWNLKRRREIAQIYRDGLSNHPDLHSQLIPEHCSPSWLQYSILTENKLSFYKHMQSHEIDLSWTYRYSCADSYGLNSFPNSQKAAKTVLGLPTYPTLTNEQARQICTVAWKYSSRKRVSEG